VTSGWARHSTGSRLLIAGKAKLHEVENGTQEIREFVTRGTGFSKPQQLKRLIE
jgi:hypothetical protein